MPIPGLILLLLGGAALAAFGRPRKEQPFPYPLLDVSELERQADEISRQANVETLVTSTNPNYRTKYSTEVLRLSALPDSKTPIMLCSYVKVASLEAMSTGEASTQLQGMRQKYESAIENLYGRRGRPTIVRLIRRYFDPKTFQELPGDLLWESSDKFPIPLSPLPGIPCG